jgi:hypothetical protein
MTENKRLTQEIVNKLMDLFTTPLEEVEEYRYEDAEYGGSRRKRKRKNKTKTRKTKRAKKTKRVTSKRYSKRRRIYRK